MLYFCLFVFLSSVNTIKSTTEQNSSDIVVTVTDASTEAAESFNTKATLSVNATSSIQRITEPIQHTGRGLNIIFPGTNRSVANETKFKPSPQLETYLEYNKFPVKPAVSEAKTSTDDGSYFPNTWMEKQSNWEQNSWTDNPQQVEDYWTDASTTESPWATKVKFPSDAYLPQRPYKYIPDHEIPTTGTYPVTTEGFNFNKPVPIPEAKQKMPHNFWSNLMGYDVKDNLPESRPKMVLDYNLLEKPPQYGLHVPQNYGYDIQYVPQKDYGYDIPYGQHLVNGHYDLNKGYGYDVGNYRPQGKGINPWKKILKFLAAIIPIGLFISALTPTVITVTSVNDTQSRYRAEDSQQELAKRVASSFTYFNKLNEEGCDDKVMCELLASAAFSKNSLQHVKVLLDNFVNREVLENKKEDLLKIFEAAKNQNCASIICGNIKNPT